MDIHAACWKKEQRCQDNRGLLSCKGFSIRQGRNTQCCWPSVETNHVKRSRHWIVLLYFWELTLQPRGPHVLLQILLQGWSSWLLLHHPTIISNVFQREMKFGSLDWRQQPVSMFNSGTHHHTSVLAVQGPRAACHSDHKTLGSCSCRLWSGEACQSWTSPCGTATEKPCWWITSVHLSSTWNANSPQICTTECGKFTATLFLTG